MWSIKYYKKIRDCKQVKGANFSLCGEPWFQLLLKEISISNILLYFNSDGLLLKENAMSEKKKCRLSRQQSYAVKLKK